MDKKTKLLLSILGIAAIVVPAVLLVVLSGRSGGEAAIGAGQRQLDTQKVVETVEEKSKQVPLPSPSPTPPAATSSAQEATSAAQ